MNPAQEAVWYEEELRTDGSNTGSFSVTLAGNLEEPAIEAACAAVVERHRALRSLVTLAARPLLAVQPPGAVPLAYGTVEHPCAPGGEAAATRDWWQQHGKHSFDLTTEPPLWFRVLRHGTDRRTLLIVVHHLCFDGRSKFVFARDFTAALTSIRDGRKPSVPGRSPAADRLAAADPELDSRLLAEAVAHWNALDPAELPPLRLPASDVPSAVQVLRPPAFTLTGQERDRLAELAGEAGTTLFGGLLAVLAAQLYGYGNDKVALSVPADTSTPQGRAEIGVAINVVPLLITPGPGPSFRSVLDSVRQELARLRRHRRVPFRQLAARTSWVRPGAPSPFTNASAAFLRLPPDIPDPPGLRSTWEFATPNTSRSFDLMYQLRDGPSGIHGRLECLAAAVGPQGAAELTAHFPAVARQAVARPDAPLNSLSAATRGRSTLPTSAMPCPPSGTKGGDGVGGIGSLADLFAEQVRLHPDRPAVAGPGPTVTYRELDRIAAELAPSLKDAGAGSGKLVTVPLFPTAQQLGILLGALRTGAGVLPVAADPTAQDTPAEITDASGRPDGAWWLTGSGGTRTPLSPAHLARSLRWQADRLALPGRPVRTPVLAATGSYAFLQELFLTWLSGGTLILPQQPGESHGGGEGEGDAAPARAALAGDEAGLLAAPYRLLRELAELPGRPPSPLDVLVPLSGVRPSTEVSAWLRDGLRLHAQYVHPTVGLVAMLPADAAEEALGDPGPLTLAPGLRASVWGPGGTVLPPGVAGELMLRLPHQDGQPDAEPLPTGDRAVIDRDGTLRHLGPLTGTANWAGQSLDQAAVERKLCAHPHVRDASVTVDGGRVVAYVQPHRSTSPDLRDLRRLLKHGARHRELRVARIVVVDTLPPAPIPRTS